MKYYVYELVLLSEEKVCYIGKGTGKRMYAHKRNVSRASYSNERLYKFLRGKDFYPRKVFETENEIEAYAEETRRIEEIGIDSLLNSAIAHRTVEDRIEARRVAISKGKKGIPLSDSHKNALRVRHIINPETEKNRAKTVSVIMKEMWKNGEIKGNSGRKRPCSPERRAAIIAGKAKISEILS